MTPDQIRQIAEEYVDSYTPSDIDKEVRKGLVQSAILHYKFLAKRYCVVERSKVEEEMEAAKWHKETAEGINIQYGKGMANGQIMVLENLFGPETFNEK